MIFASDLDRTLIYSRSFIDADMNNIIPVERKGDEFIAYMSETSLRLLEEISRKITFIPVTSRSLEQYKRVFVFNNRIQSKYAVVANGGIIIKNGEKESGWTSYIDKQIAEIVGCEELTLRLKSYLTYNSVKSYRCCDNIFLYVVFHNEEIENDYLKQITSVCSQYGYVTVKNGRKVYILPHFINKWEPLKYIMELEGESHLLTAGDSFLDIPMLKNSISGFIPAHGELNKLHRDFITKSSNLYCTEIQGIYSSDEFLKKIDAMCI